MNKKTALPICVALLVMFVAASTLSPSGVFAGAVVAGAAGDAYAVEEDTPLAIAAPGVLANDDGEASLAAALVDEPSHGAVALDGDGSFIYTPYADYYGPDSFIYYALGSTGPQDTATVTITVNPVNDAPVAVADEYVVAYSPTIAVGVDGGVLSNDADPDNDTLTAELVAGVANGELTLRADGAFDYTPANSAVETDTFSYRASDGVAQSAVTVVTITLDRGDPPVAESQNVVATAGVAQEITLVASDPDGDPLIYTIVQQPAHGGLTGAGPTWTYTPDANYTGSDSFTFKVSAGGQDSNTATVNITVIRSNEAPVAVDDTYLATENTLLTVNVANGVLKNDSDANGDLLTASLADGPDSGALTLNADGSFTYDPDDDFYETDRFTYRAYDGMVYSEPATVTIEVKSSNQPPTAIPQTVQTDEETPVSITLTGSDPDGDTLTFTLLTQPEQGTLTGAPPILVYTPDALHDGSDSFTFSVSDGESSDEAKVDIVVIAVNDPPALDLNGDAPGTGYSAIVAVGGTARSITSGNLTITDPDNNTMASASVEIVNRKHGANEILSVDAAGTDIAVSFETDGDLLLSGAASFADYEKALRSVKYRISPEVASPDKEDRQIVFQVFDGADNSPAATSVVEIIQPDVQITITDQMNPVPKGTDFFFKVTIKNSGDVDLEDVVVEADMACNKTYALITAGGSKTYTCNKISNVQNRIDNQVTVTARDIHTHTEVSDSDIGTMLVIPDIGIFIVPEVSSGDVMLKGDSAVFNIIVQNPSQSASLEQVKVTTSLDYEISNDPTVPTQPQATPCDRDIGLLGPGGSTSYTCTIPNVLESFAITAEATGLIEGIYLTENYDVAEIGVIELVFEVLSDPFEIPAGTAYKVTFDLSLQNTSSVPLVLDGLASALHGDLLNKDNPNSGTCSNLKNKDIPANKSANCSYEVWLTLEPPLFANEITAIVSATGSSGLSKQLIVTDEAFVSLTDYSPLAIVAGSNPRSLVAPGGQASITLQVTNQTPIALTLDLLTDSIVGSVNGKGNCVLPRVIPGGGSYTCTYPVAISGKKAGETATHEITAQADARQASNAVSIPITALPTTYVMMPSIVKEAVAGEPNDSLCAAMPLMTNQNYYFFADDDRDWYRFTLKSPGHINVTINNFTVTDGQLAVYAGDTCSGVGGNPIGHNGQRYAPIRELDLGIQPAGTYYVLVLSVEGLNFTTPYTLRIGHTQP